MAFVPNDATFYLAAILAGYGFGGLEPALQSMAVHTARDESRGSANSTFLCAYDIGIGVGAGIAGVLITNLGYGSMWAIMSVKPPVQQEPSAGHYQRTARHRWRFR